MYVAADPIVGEAQAFTGHFIRSISLVCTCTIQEMEAFFD